MKKYFPVFVLISLLTSCNNSNVDILSHTVPGNFIDGKYFFPMNTLVTLRTFNENQQEEIAKGFDDVVISLSKEVDRYHDYADINNLKTINDSCGLDKEIKISDNLFELIKLSIDLTKLTEGKFTNHAFKAYLPVAEGDAAPAMFSFGRGEGTTGIEQIVNNENVVIYDLAGRRVQKMEKGIYIVNGKKVIR